MTIPTNVQIVGHRAFFEVDGRLVSIHREGHLVPPTLQPDGEVRLLRLSKLRTMQEQGKLTIYYAGDHHGEHGVRVGENYFWEPAKVFPSEQMTAKVAVALMAGQAERIGCSGACMSRGCNCQGSGGPGSFRKDIKKIVKGNHA